MQSVWPHGHSKNVTIVFIRITISKQKAFSGYWPWIGYNQNINKIERKQKK